MGCAGMKVIIFRRKGMRVIRGFGSMLGHGIINGCPTIVGVVSEVVGVDSRGMLYGRLRVCKRISSSLVWRILGLVGFLG
jgi:hypothetical protein